MDDLEFEKLVGEGIDKIPEPFKKKIDNVAFIIEDEPSPEQLKQMHIDSHHMLFGLYQGISQIRRGDTYNAVLPDKITIFKKPILAIAQNNPDLIRQQVYDTVWHEIGHHFGLSEEQARKRVAEIQEERKFVDKD